MTQTSTRYESRLKPRYCPSCRSAQIADILYGVPYFDDQLEADLATGRVTLGGRQAREDSPRWQCVDCQTVVHRVDEPDRLNEHVERRSTAR